MSEFREKLIIALVSVISGAGLALASNSIMQNQAEESAREETARQWSYEFLKEEYDSRKESYLAIKNALQRVSKSGAPDDVDELIDAINMLPILYPRYPTNFPLLQLSDEFEERLDSISDDPQAIKNFVNQETEKYICIMDVNLSVIERLLSIIATEEELRKIFSAAELQGLDFLAGSCFEDEFKVDSQ